MCHLLDRFCDHCSPCTTRRGNPNSRPDPTLRIATRYYPNLIVEGTLLTYFNRISNLLHIGHHLRQRDGLQSCAEIWAQKPFDLHLYLLERRIYYRNVGEGIWYCSQTHPGGQ